MVLKRNSKRTGEIIQLLLRWSDKKKGIFKDEMFYLPKKGVKESSENAFFLTTTMLFNSQRNADILWAAAEKTWKDPSTRWVFFPRKIIQRTTTDKLEKLEKALDTYGFSWRPKDSERLRKVSDSFLKYFDGNPINLLKEYDYDAHRIFVAMRTKYAKDFPYLAGATGGSKILLVWLRLLHKHVKKLKNLEPLPIPMDVHVRRATITTGCLVGKFYSTDCELDGDAKGAWSEACEDLRRKKKSHQTAFEFDEVLFKRSFNVCSRMRRNEKCPEREECELYPKYCVTANPKFKIDLGKPIQIDTTYPS